MISVASTRCRNCGIGRRRHTELKTPVSRGDSRSLSASICRDTFGNAPSAFVIQTCIFDLVLSCSSAVLMKTANFPPA